MNHFQLVCFLGIVAIAHAGGDSKTKEEKQFIEECVKELKASEEDAKLLDSDELPKTKAQYCLTACFYKKYGIMNDDNTINIDKVLDVYADVEKENKELYEKIVKVVQDCHAKYTPTKECDSMKTHTECTLKSFKEAGIPLE